MGRNRRKLRGVPAWRLTIPVQLDAEGAVGGDVLDDLAVLETETFFQLIAAERAVGTDVDGDDVPAGRQAVGHLETAVVVDGRVEADHASLEGVSGTGAGGKRIEDELNPRA